MRTRTALYRVSPTLLLGGAALVYAFGVLWACGVIPGWGEWYSASTSFENQTVALLRGDLALSHSVADLNNDFCWSQGGVNQVWGLGVPFWRLPFEMLARLLGKPAFPDRVTMGLFMALAAMVVLKTWLGFPWSGSADFREDESGSRRWKTMFVAFGAVQLSVFFAPLTNLLLSRMAVYEEVMVYFYFYGLLLLSGVVALSRRPRWKLFYVLCALAGLGGLVRPTLVFYGGATVLISGYVMWRSQKSEPGGKAPGEAPLRFPQVASRSALGLLLFAAGGGLLFLANLFRFGDGFEFGHSLTLQSGNLLPSVYSTRFDYPFAHAPLWQRARELFGALFEVRDLNGFDYYRQRFFPGQSGVFRWREFPFSTYDLSYAVCIALACFAWVWSLWRYAPARVTAGLNSPRSGKSTCSLPGSLLLWGLIAVVPLSVFYLKTPVIASRYMFDFAPSFVAFLIGFWIWIAEEITVRNPKWLGGFLCLLLVGWQGAEMVRSRGERGAVSVPFNEQRLLHQAEPNPELQLRSPDEYKLGDMTQFCRVPFNGEGWNTITGETEAAVELFVDEPQYLVIDLAPADSTHVGPVDYDCIQAKIGLEFLERESIAPTAEGAQIVFRGPIRSRYQTGIQVLFLAMTNRQELKDGPSRFRLLRVRWHREMADQSPSDEKLAGSKNGFVQRERK